MGSGGRLVVRSGTAVDDVGGSVSVVSGNGAVTSSGAFTVFTVIQAWTV